LAYSLGVVLNLNVLYVLTASVVLAVILIYVRLARQTTDHGRRTAVGHG
jgi:hypothetical protein